MALAGYNSPTQLFRSASGGTISGSFAVASGELVVVAFTGVAGSNNINWSAFTATLGSENMTTYGGTTPGFTYASTVFFVVQTALSGSQTFTVNPNGASFITTEATYYRITGHNTTTPIPGSSTNSSYSNDVTTLSIPVSRTTVADGNVILSAWGQKDGRITGIGATGADAVPISGVTGTNQFNDHGYGHAYKYMATAGAVSIAWSWTTAGRCAGSWIEVAAGATGISGAGAGAMPLGGGATGGVGVAGAGSGTMPLGGAGAGTVGSAPATGDATGTMPLGGTAAGKVSVAGSGAGSMPLSGGAAGDVDVSGAGSGTMPVGGSGAGTVGSTPVAGDAAGTMPLGGASGGKVGVAGAGAGQMPLGGSSAGKAAAQGLGAGQMPMGGAATGKAAVQGAGAGAMPIGGAGAGTAGSVTITNIMLAARGRPGCSAIGGRCAIGTPGGQGSVRTIGGGQ